MACFFPPALHRTLTGSLSFPSMEKILQIAAAVMRAAIDAIRSWALRMKNYLTALRSPPKNQDSLPVFFSRAVKNAIAAMPLHEQPRYYSLIRNDGYASDGTVRADGTDIYFWAAECLIRAFEKNEAILPQCWQGGYQTFLQTSRTPSNYKALAIAMTQTQGVWQPLWKGLQESLKKID